MRIGSARFDLAIEPAVIVLVRSTFARGPVEPESQTTRRSFCSQIPAQEIKNAAFATQIRSGAVIETHRLMRYCTVQFSRNRRCRSAHFGPDQRPHHRGKASES